MPERRRDTFEAVDETAQSARRPLANPVPPVPWLKLTGGLRPRNHRFFRETQGIHSFLV
jgi:hypothetical protein